ncbi:hypothetical protein EV178_001932 [Coemansia sp. RSA 1646]|nr:hypothetical protein EV178_001932 [Coemansia sp. RSA 1646]
MCPHCRSFKPKWDNAMEARAQKLAAQDVHFGELDCYENYKLCNQIGVTAWPAVIAFSDGKRFAYMEGDKTEEEALDFIDKAVEDRHHQSDTVVGAQRKYTENSVVLDAANYTQHAHSGVWLVKHYSPYCPHCNDMKPEWIRMTDELAADLAKDGILFGEVNCLDNRKLCETNLVDGFPTINLFVDGRFVEEMVVKYTYEYMKNYAAKLPKRLKSGELDKSPEPVVANDNRDWDDMDDSDLAKQQALQQQNAVKHDPSKDDAARDALAEKPNAEANNTEQDNPKKEGELGAAIDKHDDAPVYNAEGAVVALTNENFAEKTAKGPWFIKFYADWCPHCQQLAPVWEKLADSVKGRINIGKVNCEETGSLCSKHGVQGYPTLKMLWEGETNDYKGSRDFDNLLDYVDRMLAHPVDAQSADDLHRMQKEHEVVFVFAHDAKDSTARTTTALARVKASAKKMFLSKQLLIAGSTELAHQILPDQNDQSLPVLVALKDGKTTTFGGLLTSDDDLREWFYAERFSMLPELSRENADGLFYDSDYLVLAVLDSSQGLDYMKHYRDVVRSAAAMHQRDKDTGGEQKSATVRFTWVDGNKWEGYIERVFRIRRASWPAIVIAQPNEDRYYVADARSQPIEPSKMGIFMAVRDAMAGKLRYETNKSIIMRAAHGVAWAVKSVWLVLFGSPLRILVSVSVIALFVCFVLRRGRGGRRRRLSTIGPENLVKAD